MEPSTPPLTPPICERRDLPLVDEHNHHDFSSRFSQLNLSPSNSSSRGCSSLYQTTSYVTPNQGEGNTYTPPRRLAQHHSLPTTRLPSFDGLPSIARASSDQGAFSPQVKESSTLVERWHRTSAWCEGLQRSSFDGPKIIIHCPPLPAETSLRSVDSSRLKPASSASPSRSHRLTRAQDLLKKFQIVHPDCKNSASCISHTQSFEAFRISLLDPRSYAEAERKSITCCSGV